MSSDGAEAALVLPDAEDQRRKAEARARWEADRGVLVFRQPFVASLAMHLDIVPVVDDRVPTACTDGRRIFVSPAFLATLDADERVFVLAHEVWHCALLHLTRRGDRDPERWNVAIDHEVNALLREQDFRMPRDGVLFGDLVGLNAEEVYERLENGRARGRLADEHLEAGCAIAPRVGRYDPDFAPHVDRETLRRWPERLVAAAQRHAPGRLPLGLARVVEGLTRPKLPWREILRQFVTRLYGGDRRWLPPSRRHLPRGLYLPSRRGETVTVTVAIDTSGSTTAFVPAFLAELGSLVASFGRYRVRVIECDCAIHADETFDDDRRLDPERHVVRGGGGTSFAPVFDRLAGDGEPGALVYLTDGYGDAPETPPPWPVLWVLTPGGTPPAPWGEVLWLPIEAGEET